MQAPCEKYIEAQDFAHDPVADDQPQIPLDSHVVESCTRLQDCTQVPDLETHWQFASDAHATFAEYKSPHLSVHVAPFHWHVVSFAQSALFVFRAHETLQVCEAGFHEHPGAARQSA